jgi:3-hydroxyisobutyrate dehydrogenase
MKVGYIGLGNMGGPVAGHIQRAGFDMVVYDARPEAGAPFVAAGAKLAGSAAEVAAEADVTLAALPTAQIVEAVALGPNGVLEGIRPDGVYAEMSTNSPELVKRLEERFRARGAWFMDAPVSAGKPGSAPGIHEILIGGERAVFERMKPVLEAYGDQIIYTGEVGSASTCKIIHQLIGSCVAEAIAEGLSLGVKAGLDVKLVWDAVRRGLVGRMQMLHEQVPRSVFPGTYEPSTFTVGLLRKDVGFATALGRQLGVPLPLANLVEQDLVEALNRGWANHSGYTACFERMQESAGVDLRASGIDADAAARYIEAHSEYKAF